MGPHSGKSPNCGNFEAHTWKSQDKMTFGCWSYVQDKVNYKGEGGGFPQVQAMVSFVSSSLLVTHLNTKSALVMH